jgi:hypothetical protein
MRNWLQNYEIAGTAVLVVILGSLAFALILGLWRPILLMKLLGLAQSGIKLPAICCQRARRLRSTSNYFLFADILLG